MKKTFRAIVSTTPDDNLFIEIPFDVKATFGKARPPVIVTLGKHTYRSTISVYAGKSLLGIRKSHAKPPPSPPAQRSPSRSKSTTPRA